MVQWGAGFAHNPVHRVHRYLAPLVSPRGAQPASRIQSSRAVDVSRDNSLGQLVVSDDGASGAPSSRSIRSVPSEFVVRRPCDVSGLGARHSSEVVRYPSIGVGPQRKCCDCISILTRLGGISVEVRMVSRQWVSLGQVAQEWSVWCRPRVHRPSVRSAYVDVGPPNVGRSFDDDLSDVGDGSESFDSRDMLSMVAFWFVIMVTLELVGSAPICNKFVGRLDVVGLWGVLGRVRLRNIKVGQQLID